MYFIEFNKKAQKDLKKLSSFPLYYNKLEKLIEELKIHPETGTGKPEQLKYNDVPTWSRRISEKHRLVYEIQGEVVTVLVISAYGHYNDK